MSNASGPPESHTPWVHDVRATELEIESTPLRALALEIGNWRRSKQFFTPDASMMEEPCPAVLTNADAMLGKLMLVVTEVAEAAEACRKGDYPNFCEEIADTFIRLFDIVDSSHIDLDYHVISKMVKNHQRAIKHGKKTVL
jgi:NTP pyrophosphatase (non-canonical NTP hydrolase)